MKFLCIACDEPMKITSAGPPSEGSITAVFACPTCSHQIAMLTNPHETQMVQSLGVKIGPQEQAAGAQADASDEAASGCPFSGMLGEMEARKDEEINWTSEAAARLENIPEFVRPMAKQGIEHFARTNGHAVIDDAVMEEARGQFGM